MPASPYQEPEPARTTASSVLLFPPVSSFSATIRRRFSHRPRRFVDRPGRSVPLSTSPNDRPVATIPRPELTTDYLAVFVVLVVVQTHRERVATPVYVHEPRRSPSQSRRHSPAYNAPTVYLHARNICAPRADWSAVCHDAGASSVSSPPASLPHCRSRRRKLPSPPRRALQRACARQYRSSLSLALSVARLLHVICACNSKEVGSPSLLSIKRISPLY